MSNNENKGVKIQHHRYNNRSRRNKRKLHKGRVAGAILSVALVIGLGIGGYKLISNLSIGMSSGSVQANNPMEDDTQNDVTMKVPVETVQNPSVDVIVTTTPITTTTTGTDTNITTTTPNSTDTATTITGSSISGGSSTVTTKTTIVTEIDEHGNIIIPESTNYQNYSSDDIKYNNPSDSNEDNRDEDDYYDSKANITTTTTTTTQNNNNTSSGNNGGSTISDTNAYYLNKDDISSLDSLQSSLNKVENSSNIVVLPLKSQGGLLNYNSKINSAKNSGVVGSYVDLNDMVETIKNSGYTPYASISVLYDNIYPKTYKKTAYQFEDGTGSWWDNSAENGGKPWLSPFSNDTLKYLSAIASELTEDGIEGIICEDVIFPEFRDKDLDYIGDLVKSSSRYTALLDVLDTIQNSANGKQVFFKFSLVDALSGDVEALKPSEMNQKIILTPYITISELSSSFTYNGNSISLSDKSTYDKVKLSMEMFEKMSGDMEVVPSINVSDLTASQKKDVISALQDLGYTNYLLQ